MVYWLMNNGANVTSQCIEWAIDSGHLCLVRHIFGSWYSTDPVEAFDLIGYACRRTGHESILYWICIQPYVPIHQ